MRRNTAFPFNTIPDEMVEFSPWMLGTRGEPLHPAREILESWDYVRALEVSCAIKLPLDKIADHLGIPPEELGLEAVLRAGTGRGRFPRKVWELERRKVAGGEEHLELRGCMEGGVLSSRLHLECLIVLSDSPAKYQAASPVKVGSRLWSKQFDVLLEDGGDSRFPMESLSFRDAFSGEPHELAPWYFYWSPGNYDMDFTGATRLYVNTDTVEMHKLLVAGDPVALQSVVYDVFGQLLAGAVSDEYFWSGIHDFHEGSVGGQLRNWLDMAFPGKPMGAVQSLYRHKPGAFNAAVLSVADMGVAK